MEAFQKKPLKESWIKSITDFETKCLEKFLRYFQIYDFPEDFMRTFFEVSVLEFLKVFLKKNLKFIPERFFKRKSAINCNLGNLSNKILGRISGSGGILLLISEQISSLAISKWLIRLDRFL